MSAALLPDASALVFVDLQDRGFRQLDDAHRRGLLDAAAILRSTATRLQIPVLATEIDPRSHGRTLPQLSGLPTIEHKRLSAAPELLASLLGRTQIVLAGVEAHLGVAQTAAELLDHGLEPWILVDAVASQQAMQAEVALQRLARDGVRMSTVEACLFAWVPDVTDMLHHELWRTLR